MKRPTDAKPVEGADDLEYSESQQLYYVPSTQRVYDERSAAHNGIIGAGAQLRRLIKETNS